MFLSKYGVARHIYIPIPKAGSANHAVSADWTPAAGDVKISKDGGATANVTNLPTAIAMGNSTIWDFSLTLTELTAAQVVVTIADSATKAVDDTGFIVETYGNASAQHALDLGTALASQTVGTATAVTTVNGLAAAVITAASIAADAITDAKVAADVTIASITGNVGGNVVGSVGSIAVGGIVSGAHAAAELNAIADAILDRNMGTGTDNGTDSTVVRTVRQALRRLRNKEAIVAGVGTVYKENDVTASFTYAATATAGNPLSATDPT